MLLEERTASLEIQALEKKFDSWSQLANDSSLTKQAVGQRKPLASARDITKDLPPEVAAFEVITFFIDAKIVMKVIANNLISNAGF